MPRPLLVSPDAGPRHTIAAIGDSLTHNITLGCAPHLLWPKVLADSLLASGYRVKGRNRGISGNTTTQMLARVAQLTRTDIPKAGIIFGGVNDPGNGISQATTQANIEAMIAALFAAGTTYAVVVSPQYRHWTTGGDTTGASKPAGSYANVYDAQVAAVAAKVATYPGRVAFCDLWDYMRDLIVADPTTYAVNVWHTSADNQHLNALGQSIVAAAVRACIAAQTGWFAALQAN